MSKQTRELRKQIIERFSFRPCGVEDGHIIVYACDSLTRYEHPGHEIRHDLNNGSVSCSCEDFQTRKQRNFPMWESAGVCKHIRFIRDLLNGD